MASNQAGRPSIINPVIVTGEGVAASHPVAVRKIAC